MLLLRSGDYRSELQSMLQTGLIASLRTGRAGQARLNGQPRDCGPVVGMALPAWSGPGARRPGVAAGSCALLGRTAVLAAVAALAVGAPAPFRLWPPSALSGGNLPIQTSAGQSGPGAPACSNARFSRASGSRLGDRCGAGRGERVNLLPRLLWSNTDASGYRLTLLARSGRPWSTPCTASPSGAGVPTRACPSTSPPLVSALCGPLPGLLHPALSAQKGRPHGDR